MNSTQCLAHAAASAAPGTNSLSNRRIPRNRVHVCRRRRRNCTHTRTPQTENPNHECAYRSSTPILFTATAVRTYVLASARRVTVSLATEPSEQIAPWPGSGISGVPHPCAHPASAIAKYDSTGGDDLLLAKRKGQCHLAATTVFASRAPPPMLANATAATLLASRAPPPMHAAALPRHLCRPRLRYSVLLLAELTKPPWRSLGPPPPPLCRLWR